jgi:hypothetical protein
MWIGGVTGIDFEGTVCPEWIATVLGLRERGLIYSPCSIIQRSASIAAMQPVPAAVIAWR